MALVRLSIIMADVLWSVARLYIDGLNARLELRLEQVWLIRFGGESLLSKISGGCLDRFCLQKKTSHIHQNPNSLNDDEWISPFGSFVGLDDKICSMDFFVESFNGGHESAHN
jgi:hypothetical protein